MSGKPSQPYQPLLLRILHGMTGLFAILAIITAFWTYDTYDGRWGRVPLPKFTENKKADKLEQEIFKTRENTSNPPKLLSNNGSAQRKKCNVSCHRPSLILPS